MKRMVLISLWALLGIQLSNNSSPYFLELFNIIYSNRFIVVSKNVSNIKFKTISDLEHTDLSAQKKELRNYSNNVNLRPPLATQDYTVKTARQILFSQKGKHYCFIPLIFKLISIPIKVLP